MVGNSQYLDDRPQKKSKIATAQNQTMANHLCSVYWTESSMGLTEVSIASMGGKACSKPKVMWWVGRSWSYQITVEHKVISFDYKYPMGTVINYRLGNSWRLGGGCWGRTSTGMGCQCPPFKAVIFSKGNDLWTLKINCKLISEDLQAPLESANHP